MYAGVAVILASGAFQLDAIDEITSLKIALFTVSLVMFLTSILIMQLSLCRMKKYVPTDYQSREGFNLKRFILWSLTSSILAVVLYILSVFTRIAPWL